MNQNDSLRRSLETVPRQRPSQTADVQRLQRTVDQFTSQLDTVRQRQREAHDELQMMQRDNRSAYEALESIKRQSQRIKGSNSELQDRLRQLSARQLAQVFRHRRSTVSVPNSSANNQEHGLVIRHPQETRLIRSQTASLEQKYRDLQSIHAALARKSDANQNQIRQLKQAIQRQGRKSLSMQQNIRRKIQQSQGVNSQLKHRTAGSRTSRPKTPKANASSKISPGSPTSTKKEIAEIKAMMEKKRRQSTVNEDNLLRKHKQVEDEKKGLLTKANQNEEKARDDEHILDNLSHEVEVQRGESMAMQKGATDKIKALKRQNAELSNAERASKERQAEDQRKLRELYESIKDKENKYKEYIQEISRKSNLHEDEIRLLQQQLEKERRKSLADQAQIKSLNV